MVHNKAKFIAKINDVNRAQVQFSKKICLC